MKQEEQRKATVHQPVHPFPYTERPVPHEPFLREDINLQAIFDSLQSEMTLQQNKRDQIIAFYLTALGLLSTFLFSADIHPLIRVGVFSIAFIIGHFWSTVILRYRIYKESYWIALRTVSCLFSEDRAKIDKGLIQHLYYKCMEKNFKDNISTERNRINERKVRKGNRSSAEYLMFLTLAFLTALAGGMILLMIFIFLKVSLWISIPIGLAFVLFYIFLARYQYSKELSKFYLVLIDGENSSFNRAFKKAWQLHLFS